MRLIASNDSLSDAVTDIMIPDPLPIVPHVLVEPIKPEKTEISMNQKLKTWQIVIAAVVGVLFLVTAWAAVKIVRTKRL